MPESDISFAKIAANPTPTTWSQAYNAGKLFAVLSLEKKTDENPSVEPTAEEEEGKIDDKDFLAILGKSILDTLENEYFTLEAKALDPIKNAILITAHKIPDDVKASFVITALVKNALYVFILGSGRVYLKRDTTFGPILQLTADEETPIKAASGFVQEEDVIILETKQFSDIIPAEKLTSVIDNLPPNEIVETLAPTIHGHEQGGAAAVVISFKNVSAEAPSETSSEDKEDVEEDKTLEEGVEEAPIKTTVSKPNAILGNITAFLGQLFGNVKLKRQGGLNHSKKMYLSIAVIIVIVLVTSIFLAIKKQNEAKVKAMFDGVYPQALKKYEEGQSLVDLNQNLARDSFNSSKKVINDNIAKFAKDSKEQKQLQDLLSKVDKAVGVTSGINTVEAKEVETDKSDFLKFVTSSKAIAFGQDKENIYSVDKDGVYSVVKGKENTKQIIKNDGDFKNPAGVSPYLSNIYVLDKTKGGVVKFVGGSDGFGKAKYFTDSEPDLSSAKSIAIDGSIWILLSDGTVLKYTKGKADAFDLTGLDSPLSSPSKIYANTDLNNVYVLDNGNSRIVVLDKTGNYKEQYSSTVLSSAKELDILESDKKILVLSSGKIYQIDLK
jgi:hypothetical protein